MLQVKKVITVLVQDINESPTDLHITNSQLYPKDKPVIEENIPAGAVVGIVEALDQDAVLGLTFELIDDANGLFQLESSAICSYVNNKGNYIGVCVDFLNVMLNI